MIIIVAWIESDTDKIKITIELYSLRSRTYCVKSEKLLFIKRTQSRDCKFPLYYSKTLIVYNIQYIYAYTRTHACARIYARVYMRMYVQCCKWRVCGEIFICGVTARMDPKTFRLYYRVFQSIRIFMWILLFKVKSTYLSNIMHDNYKT